MTLAARHDDLGNTTEDDLTLSAPTTCSTDCRRGYTGMVLAMPTTVLSTTDPGVCKVHEGADGFTSVAISLSFTNEFHEPEASLPRAETSSPTPAVATTTISEELALDEARDDIYPPLAELCRAAMTDAEWAVMSDWEKDLWEMKHLPEKERLNSIEGIVMWLPMEQRDQRRSELLDEVPRFGEPTTASIQTSMLAELYASLEPESSRHAGAAFAATTTHMDISTLTVAEQHDNSEVNDTSVQKVDIYLVRPTIVDCELPSSHSPEFISCELPHFSLKAMALGLPWYRQQNKCSLLEFGLSGELLVALGSTIFRYILVRQEKSICSFEIDRSIRDIIAALHRKKQWPFWMAFVYGHWLQYAGQLGSVTGVVLDQHSTEYSSRRAFPAKFQWTHTWLFSWVSSVAFNYETWELYSFHNRCATACLFAQTAWVNSWLEILLFGDADYSLEALFPTEPHEGNCCFAVSLAIHTASYSAQLYSQIFATRSPFSELLEIDKLQQYFIFMVDLQPGFSWELPLMTVTLASVITDTHYMLVQSPWDPGDNKIRLWNIMMISQCVTRYEFLALPWDPGQQANNGHRCRASIASAAVICARCILEICLKQILVQSTKPSWSTCCGILWSEQFWEVLVILMELCIAWFQLTPLFDRRILFQQGAMCRQCPYPSFIRMVNIYLQLQMFTTSGELVTGHELAWFTCIVEARETFVLNSDAFVLLLMGSQLNYTCTRDQWKVAWFSSHTNFFCSPGRIFPCGSHQFQWRLHLLSECSAAVMEECSADAHKSRKPFSEAMKLTQTSVVATMQSCAAVTLRLGAILDGILQFEWQIAWSLHPGGSAFLEDELPWNLTMHILHLENCCMAYYLVIAEDFYSLLTRCADYYALHSAAAIPCIEDKQLPWKPGDRVSFLVASVAEVEDDKLRPSIPWDPGGPRNYRLGGKLNFMKEGLSTTYTITHLGWTMSRNN